jgi:hypothetical protein
MALCLDDPRYFTSTSAFQASYTMSMRQWAVLTDSFCPFKISRKLSKHQRQTLSSSEKRYDTDPQAFEPGKRSCADCMRTLLKISRLTYLHGWRMT